MVGGSDTSYRLAPLLFVIGAMPMRNVTVPGISVE
jgi:hypothetical protein